MNLETKTCRACGVGGLAPILSLGRTPLANALLAKDRLGADEPTYPLELVFCSRCGLVQITEMVPPQTLFADYPYFSSFSDTMLQSMDRLADRLTHQCGLNDSSLVVEVASNDGYLLQYYRQRGIPVLGIEPAQNVAEVAIQQRGIPTLSEFFGRDLADRLAHDHQQADVMHANNVLAHVPDLNGFVTGFHTLLKPHGVAVFEFPYVRDMVENLEFDTIYHEHLCYYSLTAIDRLFSRNKLKVIDVERLPIHGGSLRVYAGRDDRGDNPPSEAVNELLGQEAEDGLNGVDYYARFADRVAHLRLELVETLRELKSPGKRIAAYGASAKGSTLLNYCDIGAETLDYVVDRSTVKQGRYTPGSHLAILSPERLAEDMPDYVLLLTWNFRDEILTQQAEYHRRGGRFIIPVPNVEIV